MRKWQNMIKKNDKVEIGNILLKHVLPVYNLAPPLDPPMTDYHKI
jgi:hypothetical protein